MSAARAFVLRSPGANCDGEAIFALEQAGAQVEAIHINQLRAQPERLFTVGLLLIPGGFTFGDDVAAGKVLAVQLQAALADVLHHFRDRGGWIVGICNGFQVLLKAGLLVPATATGTVPATLTQNQPPGFVDRWVTLQAAVPQRCPLLEGYYSLYVPVAHGEGRFICQNDETLQRLEQQNQVVLRYVPAARHDTAQPYNPNGSAGDVAGICDLSGRVLGLMPHPERHVLPTQHPHWTRRGLAAQGDGMLLFRNAVRCLLA